MHSYDKPMLDLYQNEDEPGADMMTVTGGNDVYHVQIADHEFRWCQAYDPEGPDQVIDVWLSDQGFGGNADGAPRCGAANDAACRASRAT